MLKPVERDHRLKPGKLTLAYLDRYKKLMEEAGIETDRSAPILLPEYRGKMSL